MLILGSKPTDLSLDWTFRPFHFGANDQRGTRWVRPEASMPDPNEFIRRIRDGDLDAIREVYVSRKAAFLQWARKRFPTLSLADREDIWHDTIYHFVQNIQRGKLVELRSELTTYLFGVAQNLIRQQFDKDGRTARAAEATAGTEIPNTVTLQDQEALFRRMREVLEGLPQQQRWIVELRYLEGRSIPEIREIVGYASDNAVSVTLCRALDLIRKRLRP